MYEELSKEFNSTLTTHSKTLSKIAPKYIKLLPADPYETILTLDSMVKTGDWLGFNFMASAIKSRNDMYLMPFMPTYESWLYEYAFAWGRCDIFCYRVLNPMFERFTPELMQLCIKWAVDRKTYVRRASAVCMIESTQSFVVNTDFSNIYKIAELLKYDKEDHVRKGLGWLLKYAYLTYPNETLDYLKQNISILSRTTYRYALEKMSTELRKHMLQL